MSLYLKYCDFFSRSISYKKLIGVTDIFYFIFYKNIKII